MQRTWNTGTAREFAWVPREHSLIKVPLSPHQIPAMEQHLASLDAPVVRRYSVGGNVAWLAWPTSLPASHLEAILRTLDQSAIALTGTWPDPRLGKRAGGFFAERLLDVFDPERKFQRDG